MELKCCRLCGGEHNVMYNIFDENDAFKKFRMDIFILLHIKIKEDDPLPHAVCVVCFGKVDNICAFIKTCSDVQTRLRKLILDDVISKQAKKLQTILEKRQRRIIAASIKPPAPSETITDFVSKKKSIKRKNTDGSDCAKNALSKRQCLNEYLKEDEIVSPITTASANSIAVTYNVPDTVNNTQYVISIAPPQITSNQNNSVVPYEFIHSDLFQLLQKTISNENITSVNSDSALLFEVQENNRDQRSLYYFIPLLGNDGNGSGNNSKQITNNYASSLMNNTTQVIDITDDECVKTDNDHGRVNDVFPSNGSAHCSVSSNEMKSSPSISIRSVDAINRVDKDAAFSDENTASETRNKGNIMEHSRSTSADDSCNSFDVSNGVLLKTLLAKQKHRLSSKANNNNNYRSNNRKNPRDDTSNNFEHNNNQIMNSKNQSAYPLNTNTTNNVEFGKSSSSINIRSIDAINRLSDTYDCSHRKTNTGCQRLPANSELNVINGQKINVSSISDNLPKRCKPGNVASEFRKSLKSHDYTTSTPVNLIIKRLYYYLVNAGMASRKYAMTFDFLLPEKKIVDYGNSFNNNSMVLVMRRTFNDNFGDILPCELTGENVKIMSIGRRRSTIVTDVRDEIKLIIGRKYVVFSCDKFLDESNLSLRDRLKVHLLINKADTSDDDISLARNSTTDGIPIVRHWTNADNLPAISRILQNDRTSKKKSLTCCPVSDIKKIVANKKLIVFIRYTCADNNCYVIFGKCSTTGMDLKSCSDQKKIGDGYTVSLKNGCDRSKEPMKCEWKNCINSFIDPLQLAIHAWEHHYFPNKNRIALCKWNNCYDIKFIYRLQLTHHIVEHAYNQLQRNDSFVDETPDDSVPNDDLAPAEMNVVQPSRPVQISPVYIVDSDNEDDRGLWNNSVNVPVMMGINPVVLLHSQSAVTLRRDEEISQLKYKCGLCDTTYNTKESLNGHIRRLHSERNFQCSRCSRTFSGRGLLAKHMEQIHIRPYSCSQCCKTFGIKRLLQVHEYTHVKSSPNDYVCQICNKTYKAEFLLKIHVKNVHENHPKPCPKCQLILNTRSAFLSHRMKCINNVNRCRQIYTCDICQSSVSSKEVMRHHMYKHLNLKPFKCDQCSAKFSSPNYLYHHKLSHGEPAFPCPVCKIRFNRRDNMKKHCSMAHKQSER